MTNPARIVNAAARTKLKGKKQEAEGQNSRMKAIIRSLVE